MKYKIGHIDPWWNDDFKKFDYCYLPHKDNTMVDQWCLQGYTNLHLNGAIHNLHDNDYAKPFLAVFGWINSGATLYKMNTGDIIPCHTDHFITYQKKFNILDKNTIYRTVIFMEDWKSGHYFEIENTPIVGWARGDYVTWRNDAIHMASNMGLEPRFTMQITGTANELSNLI